MLVTSLRYTSTATTAMQLVADNGLLMAAGCSHTFITVNDLSQALHAAATSCGKQLTVVQQHTGSRQLQNNDASTIADDTTTSDSLLTTTELQELDTTAVAHTDSSSGSGGQHTSTFAQLSQSSTSSSSSNNADSSDHSVQQIRPQPDAGSSVSPDAISALERTQLLHAMVPHWLLVRCADANVDLNSR
jgi:hypothetical protein